MKSKSKKPAKPKLNRQRQQGAKYVPLNTRLFNYISGCRSHAYDRVLEALRAETLIKLPDYAQMQIGRDQGSFMTLLLAAIGARRAIEVGTFTGYSSICIARGLPERGRLLCLDMSQEWTDIARKYWAKAGVDRKIELRLGPAIESLKQLKPGLKFDFAFIDAHKPEYDAYYELVLPHLRTNALILFDNMLWGGRLGKKGRIKHPGGRAIDKLNRKLARDPRVESVLLSVGDGIHICRVLGR
jgi:caffeoyl-CoA O-methyltransferase